MKVKRKYKIDDILIIDTYWGGGQGKNLNKKFDSFSAIKYKDLEDKCGEFKWNGYDIFKRKIVTKDQIVIDVRKLYYEKYIPLRFFIEDQKKKTIKHNELIKFLLKLTAETLEKNQEAEEDKNACYS